MNRTITAQFLEFFLFSIGLALLGYVAWVSAESKVFGLWHSWRLGQAVQTPLPARPRAWPAPKAHEVIGELRAPRLDVSAIVVEGDDVSDLRLGAGHIPGTALPGERGNVAIAAHRDTFFRNLRGIKANDEIELTTTRGTFKYRVSSTEVVTPETVSVLRSKGRRELTLVTCYPFYYVGPAPKRFVVHALPANAIISQHP